MINSSMDEETRGSTVESAAPSKEFAGSFMSKLFQKSDLPFLLIQMMKK
ncbi:MAG: hypothetical protein IJI46_07225 [Erysipelotrichaceae bacterium]|nr:hypothetical protein [Erysipelotrichaceae bacterium]